MPLLNDNIKGRARTILDRLVWPVRLVLFTQEGECQFCPEARAMAEELTGLSNKLGLEVYDLNKDADKAAEFRVDKVPAFCVAGDRVYGFRYFGVPAGYEFTTLLSAIELAGTRDSGLKPETRQKLATLAVSADLQLFVTLSCPICPSAATMAARLAVESDKVTVSVVDSSEFPQLANLYDVMAVPKTVVSRGCSFEGARPEEAFVDEVLRGASPVVTP